MIPKALISAALFTFAIATCYAADDHPILIYPCPAAQGPPVIDGKLDDSCWQDAPLVSGFLEYGKPTLVDVQTSFRLLFDDKALFVGIRCEEPLSKRLTQWPPSHRDDHPGVFANEAIELFIDPFHDHANYYQIAASINGTVFDGKATDTSWDSDTNAAATIGESCWFLEMRVPWADLGLKQVKPGTLIGLNLCRDRNISDNKQWTYWSRTDNGFHDPQRFGHVILGGSAEEVGKLAAACRLGERSGPIRIFGNEGFSQTSYIALARAALHDLDKVLADLEATGQKEESEAVKKALKEKIDTARQQVAPLRDKLTTASAIDASEWLKSETTVSKLSEELRQCLWQVRLDALLAEI